MYRKCTSYAEQANCVRDLADSSLALLQALGYSMVDARSVALNNICMIAGTGRMTLNLLHNWGQCNVSAPRLVPQLLGINSDQVSVRTAVDHLSTSAKLALVVLAQFQIENLFRNLHRELALGAAPTGFYRCAASVLAAVGVPLDRMTTLNTAARIRNSLHTNGIHHKQHESEQAVVELRGVRFEFHNERKVECAHWEHIAHALECSVEVVGEVLRRPVVLAKLDPMMDSYAWDVATTP